MFVPVSDGMVVETSYTFSESPTIEEYVQEYYKETPILADIARCESRNRQFTKNGDIFRGEVNDRDVGVMQINEDYHLKTSKKLGYDLYSLEGNLAYGQYLYNKKGVAPWKASFKCWKKSNHLARK